MYDLYTVQLEISKYVLTIYCKVLRSRNMYELYTVKSEMSDYTRGADKSLARPNSQCILFDGENISFDASLVIYINSSTILPIVIINRIYETQNPLSL